MGAARDRWTRRELLERAGACASLAWLSRSPPGLPRGAPRADGLAPRRGGIDDLARSLTRGSSADAFAGLPERIRAGLRHEELLAAVCVAGAREIRPRPHGILHCVMLVESSFRLGDGAPEREAWLAALYNLDDFKRAQARDAGEDGDFRMQAAAGPRKGTSPGEAVVELRRALDARDPERADRAAIEVVAAADRRTTFEALWPISARCYAFLGHKQIYAAQLERTLARIGWENAEAPLRSLVASLLVGEDEDDWTRSRALAERIPSGWLARTSDPRDTLVLARALRRSTPRGAQMQVVDALQEGAGPDAVWDALRLVGSELFLARPGRRSNAGRTALLPVHAVTVTEAFGYAWSRASDETTKRLLLLQASAWLMRLREDLVEIVGLTPDSADLVDDERESVPSEQAPATPPSIDALLRLGSPRLARAFLAAHPESTAAWTAGLRSALLRTGIEHHQHKYTAALLAESARVHPTWRARLLAPAADYVADPRDEQTEVYHRSLRVLEQAGV